MLFEVSIIMLTEKNVAHNFRVLRLLVETVVQNTVQEANGDDDDLISRLRYHATSRTTAKFWADGLIKPAFLVMIFCRAETEADRSLDLRVVSLMIPYFFTAGHQNCARYGMYYHRSSEAMPKEICRQFLQGEHVTRHITGPLNGIWADMMSDDRTYFMRHGKGPRGLIGIPVNPSKWKRTGSCRQDSYFDHQECLTIG